MKSPPSSAALLFIIVAASKSTLGAVKLAQSDGDLAAHLVVGGRILSGNGIPAHSLSSYTAPGEPFVAHAWLSEMLFALLYRIGGLPMLAVVTGLTIAATHALIVVWLRRRGADPRWALTAGLISLAVAASHWLTRPHMFSILGAALTLLLLEGRWRWRIPALAGLFALWANLHGGWAFGLILIGAYAAGEWIEYLVSRDAEQRGRAFNSSVALVLCAGVTLLNPYGVGLHREVVAAVSSPLLAASIEEYMPPNFQEWITLPFLISLLATAIILAGGNRRLPAPWLLVLVASLLFALRSFRNIALFGVTAWPLIALHATRTWTRRPSTTLFGEFARIDRSAPTTPWIAAATTLLLLLGLSHGKVGGTTIVEDRFDSRIFPVEAVRATRAAGWSPRVFHPWVWGGYLMKEWPEARLHVDPLKFSDTTLISYSRIADLEPDWNDELLRWNVDVALVPARGRLAASLAAEPGWSRAYADSTAMLFTRAPVPETSPSRTP